MMDSVCTHRDHGRNSAPAFVKTDSTRNKNPQEARVPPLVKSEDAERKDAPEASGAELVKKEDQKSKDTPDVSGAELVKHNHEQDKRRAPSRDAKEGRAVLRCPWCGRPFERRASRQRFCDKHCRREWDNMRGRADRELARMEREVEAEEQRFRDLERERIHAGLLPWPEGLASRDGLSPWERDEADALGGVWANALLDPLPI